MHALFSRRVVIGTSSQLTKLVKKQPSHSRHFRSHLLPSDLSSSSATSLIPSLLSRSEKIHGFFTNTNLKLKFGNFLESRVGFFSPQLPVHGFESKGFTGFQKRGWYRFFTSSYLILLGSLKRFKIYEFSFVYVFFLLLNSFLYVTLYLFVYSFNLH